MAKPAPKKPEGKVSVFAAIRKDPALAKAIKTAKTATPGGKDYEGDDADLVCRIAQNRSGVKEGVAWAAIEFRILPDFAGQEEYAGHKCVLFFKFEDGNRGSKEEVLAWYFDALQKCGVVIEDDTDDASIEEQVDSMIENKTPIVVEAKWKGQYLNFFVKGPLGDEDDSAAQSEATDDSSESDSDSSSEDAGDAPVPSEWENYEADYTFKVKGKKTTVRYWIGNPDDENRTIDLIDADSNVVHEAVSIDDEDLTLIS